MLCPLCKVELKMTDRQGIEVDYCPQCRGIWLDRGELDKLLERAAPRAPQYTDRDMPRSRRDDDEEYSKHRGEPQDSRPRSDDRPSDYHPNDRYDQKPRKRESWLSELFDWD
jgi:Zn-finger nucleic acid-binding protein